MGDEPGRNFLAQANDLATREGEVAIGTLPAPEMLARYEALVPGAAERLLRLAEESGGQRHELERARLEAETRRANVALGTAAGVGMLCILTGFFAMLAGHAASGTLVAILGVALFAAVFLHTALGREASPRAQLPRPRGSSANSVQPGALVQKVGASDRNARFPDPSRATFAGCGVPQPYSKTCCTEFAEEPATPTARVAGIRPVMVEAR